MISKLGGHNPPLSLCITTMYSNTRPEEKTNKNQQKHQKNSKAITPINPLKPLLKLFSKAYEHLGTFFVNLFLGRDIRFLVLRARILPCREVFAMSGLDH